jgi:ABC-type polysaccharide/polyol phosphate transport system ATPase subunit
VAIDVRNVSKSFNGFKALDDVSLSVPDGSLTALLGPSGGGKSTLLRVLAGIYEPRVGSVRVEGRVTPMFDINLGIDPESTGYENIVLRGLYLGLTRAEILARRDSVAEFTELGPFLDIPVRTYSAGMQARLAFAMATCIEPEILLLDEGISAGDASFLEKANERLDHFIKKAGILVLASHSVSLVRRLCNRAVLMEHGRMVWAGDIEEGLALYLERFPAAMAEAERVSRYPAAKAVAG